MNIFKKILGFFTRKELETQIKLKEEIERLFKEHEIAQSKDWSIKKVKDFKDFFCDNCIKNDKQHTLTFVGIRKCVKEVEVECHFNNENPEENFTKETPIEGDLSEHDLYVYQCDQCGANVYSHKKF